MLAGVHYVLTLSLPLKAMHVHVARRRTRVNSDALKHSNMRQPRLELAGVHHIHNILNGQAGLRNIGRQHHLRRSAALAMV